MELGFRIKTRQGTSQGARGSSLSKADNRMGAGFSATSNSMQTLPLGFPDVSRPKSSHDGPR